MTNRLRLVVSRHRPIQFLFRNRCNLIKTSWKWSSLTARVSASYLWRNLFCPIMHFFVYFLLLDCRIWRHLENEQLRRRRDYQYYIYKVSEFKIYPKRVCSSTLKVYCIIFSIHCVEFIYLHRRIVTWSTMVHDLDPLKFWIWLN